MDRALLQRSGELKGELVRFADSERFAEERESYLTEQLGSARLRDRDAVVLATDRFALDWRDSAGLSVVSHFVESRTDLSVVERDMVGGWERAVESLFEIERHEGDGVVAVNLVNDLELRIYSNRGDRYTSRIPTGDFIHARLVPVGDAWMLSGSTLVYSAGERDRIYRLALQIAGANPQMVFQNPDKLKQAWELQARDRSEFVEFFGSDMVVLGREEIPSRMGDYMRFKTYGSRDEEGLTRAERAANAGKSVPPIPTPAAEDYPWDAVTVGFVYDETEGQLVFYNLGRLLDVFEDTTRLDDPVVAATVRSFVTDPELSPAPLLRLGARNPQRMTELVRLVLDLPDFDWTRDSTKLLRNYKAAYMDQEHTPSVIPVSDRLTAPRTLQSPVVRGVGRKVGRNDPCPCGNGKKYKVCCGR